jgi:hypothetical protein
MCPGKPSHDCGDASLINPKTVGDLLLANSSSGVKQPDASDFGCGQDRVGITLASCRIPGGASFSSGSPSFGVHVRTIISVGAKEQVVGSHAGRVVAGMADKHIGRDDPVGQFPCKTMRACVFSIDEQLPVSISSHILVGPTSPPVDDVSPEPLLHGSHSTTVRTCAAAKVTCAPPELRRPGVIDLVAVDAIDREAWLAHRANIAQLGMVT